MSNQEQDSLQTEVQNAIGAFASRFERESRALAEQLSRTQLVIALVGTVNVGKSTTVNALFGRDLAETDPLPGWTKEVKKYPLSDNLFIADTPGLEDVDESLSKEAWDYVQSQADIALFMVSATEGVRRPEKIAFTALKQTGKPMVVVVNKIDAVRPQSRVNALLDDVAKKLGVAKVVGISALELINIGLLAQEIFSLLEANKRLIFLRFLKDKDPVIRSEILRATAAAAGIGAFPLSFIPLSDMPFLTGLQMWLCIKIAHVYGIEVSKADALRFIGSTVGLLGFTGRTIFRQIIKLIGGATGVGALPAAVMAAAVAGSMTYGIGIAANEFYKSGMALDASEIQAIFRRAYDSLDLNEVRRSLAMLPDQSHS